MNSITESTCSQRAIVFLLAVGMGTVAGCASSGSADSDSASIEFEPDNPLCDPDRLIDESDIYKLDGSRLYVQNPTRGLHVIDVTHPDSPELLSRVSGLGGGAGELYVREEQVLVLFDSVFQGCELPPDLANLCDTGAIDCSDEYTAEVAAVVSVEQDPQFTRTCLPGTITGSRIVGNILYVVMTNEYVEEPTTWIFSFDISSPGELTRVDYAVMSGNGHEIHVTDTAIYVAQDVSYAAWEHGSCRGTTIHYVDIADPAGNIRVRGQITVSGQPAGRFHMNAYNGMFRIVTHSMCDDGTQLNVVDVSNPNELTLLGSLGYIAQYEDLHATRFVKDKVYIVTFDSTIYFTDPLWVISLENPAYPKILGHLEVPGWSDYVFPRGDRLLAVGRGDMGSRIAASLFDISDPHDPRELRRLEFGVDDATSEANSDFRGVRIADDGALGEVPLMVVPYTDNVWHHDGTCRPSHHLQLIDIERNDLKLRGRISENGLIRRSVPVESRLYAITDREVAAIDVTSRDTPSNLATVKVGDPSDESEECTTEPFGWWGMPGEDTEVYPLLPCSVTTPGATKSLMTKLIELLIND